MNHAHSDYDVTARVNNDEIVLDFSQMALSRMVALRRLSEGLSIKTCESWTEARESVIIALSRYLDQELGPKVAAGVGFTVVVSIQSPETQVNNVTHFFRRENIKVDIDTGVHVRGLATA